MANADKGKLSVNNFKSQFTEGARPNLYYIEMKTKGEDVGELLSFHAKGSSLPATTMGVITVPYQGRDIKVFGNRTYEEWSITIMNDEDMKIRSAFEQWIHKINSPEENLTDSNFMSGQDDNGYKVEAIIRQLKRDGSEALAYTLHGVFPSGIEAVDMAWDSNDTISESVVTLQFDWFTTSLDK